MHKAKAETYRYVGVNGMAEDIAIFGRAIHVGDVVEAHARPWEDRYAFDQDKRFEAVK